MGGYGSGRRTDRPSTGHPAPDACIRINLADLKHWGMLQRQLMNRRERIWMIGGEALARLTLVIDTDGLEAQVHGHGLWVADRLPRAAGERSPAARCAPVRVGTGVVHPLQLATGVRGASCPPRDRQGAGPVQALVEVCAQAHQGSAAGNDRRQASGDRRRDGLGQGCH